MKKTYSFPIISLMIVFVSFCWSCSSKGLDHAVDQDISSQVEETLNQLLSQMAFIGRDIEGAVGFEDACGNNHILFPGHNLAIFEFGDLRAHIQQCSSLSSFDISQLSITTTATAGGCKNALTFESTRAQVLIVRYSGENDKIPSTQVFIDQNTETMYCLQQYIDNNPCVRMINKK